MTFEIDHHLSITDTAILSNGGHSLSLSPHARQRINACRTFLDDYLTENNRPIYGVNTGFGALADTAIDNEQLRQLQLNLVRSHACGMGDEVTDEIVRAMLLLKIQGLALGHSGVHLKTVELLLELFNHHILPIVYTKGSLGASGDLAPLAHLSLPLLGEGEVRFQGERMPAGKALKAAGLTPVSLDSKEGLALLNGTQFMSAHGAIICYEAEYLFRWADVTAALSLEAMDGHLSPFHPGIQMVRPHSGQIAVAERIRNILEGSRGVSRHKAHVQDPYCLRCVPQVHGASWDMLEHVKGIIGTELISVTDNPTIFPKEGLIISAGNFHGQTLAISMDSMAIALSEIGSISERRTYKLNCGVRGLPNFLTENPGLNSGFMITQYTAASIASENKQLCTPASVDSIDSSKGQEDHVSMGANAAVKANKVLKNVQDILAIELLNAVQALDLRGLEDISPFCLKVVEAFRKEVPFLQGDEVMHSHMVNAKAFMASYDPFAHGH
jgi:histidine ammonia-lyase